MKHWYRCATAQHATHNYVQAQPLCPRLLTRLQAVKSKSCALTEISLTDCDWPEGVGASRLIEAVASSGCAPMLEKLDGIARPSLFANALY